MRHDDLGARLRIHESANDRVLLPGLFVVARIDGRGFTKLTKERHAFVRPFDERFRDLMIETTRHLVVESGFGVAYSYTQSDEISLLFRVSETMFGRRAAKWISVLAGEASARFSASLGDVACFDARLVELTSDALVLDYFCWRQDDAARNALSAHVYWALRAEGLEARAAAERLERMPVAARHELLHARGTPFQELPAWQRRGVGIWHEPVRREGRDPRSGAAIEVVRRELRIELDLPLGDAHAALLRERISEARSS